MILYSALAVKDDDLVLIGGSRAHRHFIHLHGSAAWSAAAGLTLIGAVLIFGGFDQSDPPKIRPRFRYALLIAVVGLLVGVGLSTWS